MWRDAVPEASARDPRHRDLLRRDGGGPRHARGRDPRERRRVAGGCSTRGSAASCRRSRRGGTSSWSRPSSARRSARRGATLDDVELVAVTPGPGLIGALLVGLSAAKALAWGRGLPLAPVDHLHGHVASLYLQPEPLEPPFLCLLATGGHTLLLDVRDRGGLPRGRHDDRRRRRRGVRQGRAAARPRLPGRRRARPARADGDPEAFDFPVARVGGLDFSFSGVKTALLYAVRDLPRTSSRAAAPISPRATSGRSSCALVERTRARGERARARAGSPSSAASPRTRSSAPRSPTPRSRRSRCARTTRR